MTTAALSIGASKEAIAEARQAIKDILESSADQSTKVVALETLAELCAVTGTTVSGNYFGTTSAPTNPPDPSAS